MPPPRSPTRRPGARAPEAVLLGLVAVVSWPSLMRVGGLALAVPATAAPLLVGLVLLPRAVVRVRRAPAWVLPAVVAVVLAAVVAGSVVDVPAPLGEALGTGSDRANALDVALDRLAAGAYPYTATTYLQNPITPLPGALLLAAPFHVLAGGAAAQNVAWLLLLLLLVATDGGWPLRARPTLWWALTVLGFEVLRQAVVGDDLVTGVVPALAMVVVTLRCADRSPTALVAASVALGVTTCTRPHLALVVVVVAVAVAHRTTAARGALVGVAAALAWAALVVPFLAGGTARFSPLHVAAKVTGDRTLTPAIVVVALAALVLLLGVLHAGRVSSAAGVGWCCAAVLAAPTVLSLAHEVVSGSPADPTLGAAAVPFALWAVAERVGSSAAERPSHVQQRAMKRSRPRPPDVAPDPGSVAGGGQEGSP